MSRTKKNIFADAVEERSKEQSAIEEKIVGTPKSNDFKSLPKEDKKPTTVILSRANHLALKRYSLENGITFSELINQWIEEKCAEYLDKVN